MDTDTTRPRLSKFGRFFRRSAAYLLDIVLLFTVLALLGFLVQRALGFTPQLGRDLYFVILLNFSLPVWTYFILSETRWGGATVGKRLLRVRVVADGDRKSMDGQRTGGKLTFAQSLLRTAIKLLPWELVHLAGFTAPAGSFTFLQGAGLLLANFLTILYLASALATLGKRALHDFAAGTSVIDLTEENHD